MPVAHLIACLSPDRPVRDDQVGPATLSAEGDQPDRISPGGRLTIRGETRPLFVAVDDLILRGYASPPAEAHVNARRRMHHSGGSGSAGRSAERPASDREMPRAAVPTRAESTAVS